MTSTGPGQLTADQSAELARLRAAARTSRNWSGFASAVMQHRALGVPVAVITAAAGVGESRIRQVCRAEGHTRAIVDPPGWVTSEQAAAQLGVARQRLERHWRPAQTAGVSRIVGLDRRWHADQLPDWWANAADQTAAQRRRARDARIRQLRAAGLPVHAVAGEVGVSVRTVHRATT